MSASDAKCIVVKVGTSVVSRPDGSLALGRIGSVVEQIAQLVKEGRQVVLVASGAIGIGAGKLAEQAMLSKSIRSHLHGVDPKDPSAETRWCCLLGYRAPEPATGSPIRSSLEDRFWSESENAAGEIGDLARAAGTLFDEH